MSGIDSETAISFLGLVEEISPTLAGPSGRDGLDRLEAEYEEIRAALLWFIDAGRADEALRLANGLYRFWITKRLFADGAHWFGRALALDGADETVRGRAFLYAGFMPFWMGDDDQASLLFTRALRTARRIHDAQLTSQALGGLARVALRSDVAEGRRLAREALEVSAAADDEAGRSNALHLLGVGAQIAGDLLEAREWMSQRLALVRLSNNDFLVASEASNLSMVERQLGNLDSAQALAREALEIELRSGGRFTMPFAISSLAAIALERGDYKRAAKLVGSVEAIMEATRMEWPPDERPHYERMLAELPARLGNDRFEQARSIGRSMTPTEAAAFALGASETPAPRTSTRMPS